jgi:hypothetical protein
LIIISIFFVFTNSCKKKVDDVAPEFVGNWRSVGVKPYYHFKISDVSDGFYRAHGFDEGPDDAIKGKIRIKDSKLKIGRFFKFEIIMSPTPIDTNNEKIYIEPLWDDPAYPIWPHPTKLATWKMQLRSPKTYGNYDFVYYK